MTENAISVRGLSKKYTIGRSRRQDTLRDAISSTVRIPFLWIQGKERLGAHSSEDTIWALQDISFQVRRGEVIGIIGRNGAGKSTLLKILARITEPTKGRAEIEGRVGSLLEVGTGFHPELTGRENIYLNGAILGMRKHEIQKKFDEIVEFAEVTKFLDTPVKRYSSGMYVRLAFAVAAHLEPEILLVDEVLAVGDAAFQKKCLGKMGRVAEEGRTILFVSHNMAAIQSLCQRVLWLDAGTLKSEGVASQIVGAYLRAGVTESSATERIWPEISSAPGNQTVRLHRVAVQSEDDKYGGMITMQTPLRIEVEYWNLLPAEHLHATLHVCNEQGIIAFAASAGFDPDAMLHVEPPTGLFRSICHIPGNLLNSGFHRVDLLLVRGAMALTYRLNEAINFEVVDNTERKFAWFGKEPGVVQPMLSWQTIRTGPLEGES